MENDPPIYTTTKAIEYPRTIPDTSQEKKIHELRINKFRPNYDVTTSNLHIAIKTCKQPKQSITAENSRIY